MSLQYPLRNHVLLNLIFSSVFSPCEKKLLISPLDDTRRVLESSCLSVHLPNIEDLKYIYEWIRTQLCWQGTCLLCRKPGLIATIIRTWHGGIHNYNPEFGKWRQGKENFEFKVIFSYIVSSKPAGNIWEPAPRKKRCFKIWEWIVSNISNKHANMIHMCGIRKCMEYVHVSACVRFCMIYGYFCIFSLTHIYTHTCVCVDPQSFLTNLH